VKSSKSATYIAPAIASRIVEFQNDGDLPPHVLLENTGLTASAAIRYQESDNGSNWTDIANTAGTVLPGESNQQLIVSTKARLALYAQGNTPLNVTVSKQVNGSPTNLGVA